MEMEITIVENVLDKIIVSYGQRVTKNELTLTTFAKVVEQIRSDSWKTLTEQLQQITEKEKQQEFKKKNFAYFNMGVFENNKRSKYNLIRSQYLLFDYDGLSNEDLAHLKNRLKSDSKVFCCFISPSGKGLKVIYKLVQPLTDHQKFTAVYKQYAGLFKIDLGEKPDKTSDAGRPCYFSYDPDIYINIDAEPLSINNQTTTPTTEKKQKLVSMLKGVGEGQRDNSLMSICGTLINSGMQREIAIEILKGWNQNNNPPLNEDEMVKTIDAAYERYSIKKPSFIERDNCYYKVIGKTNGSEKITSFIIQPKELLTLPGRDCLVCNIQTELNSKYENVLIENTDWHTKQKFLKALGHSDCVFLGSERDLQLLCDFTNHQIKVKKTGTKVIGLVNDMWVVKNLNITREEIKKEVAVVPYDKGDEAFYNKIVYNLLSDDEHQALIAGFYKNVLSINSSNIILPWIAWLFATPLKPLLKNTGEGFPLIFVHGSQGGGKTSTAKLFMSLCGYNISDPFSCTMRIFPMLKTLSSTNSIPVFLDEFKKSDMCEDQYDNLLRFMRKAYMGEVESKGRADQTTEDYYITAPMCVMGEWNINQPALMERMLIVRFDGSVKKEKEMQEAFSKIKELNLEGFMPDYIKFCLNQDADQLMSEAKALVESVFGDTKIAPRIKHNLSMMMLGLILFRDYASQNKIELPEFDYSSILKKQLKEITGSETGFVRSALDQFIEELAVMVSLEGFKIDSILESC